MKKKISIVTPCFNEEDNVEELYTRIKNVFAQYKNRYKYEHIYIDNASTDRTVELVKKIASKDKNVKLIVNSRNYGHIRSPFHGLLQGDGDAVMLMCSDLQDPPELIHEFIEKWESGHKIVIGQKTKSRENWLMFAIRRFYYALIKSISETEQIQNFTGFGLYDRIIIDNLKKINDPYPYFRGLIAEIGFERAIVEYTQPKRERGKSKNNFFTLYDMAMTGFVNHTKVPLRIAVFTGLFTGTISFIIALFYLIYKLVYWDTFNAGTAPLVVGMFFLASVQLFFIGIIGEYIGAIYTHVKNRPHVIEKERVNFEKNR